MWCVKSDHRNNRQPGRIERLDLAFTHAGKIVATTWTETTGWSRDLLVNGLSVVSIFAIVQHYLLYHDPQVLLMMVFGIVGLMQMQRPVSGAGEQIQAQAAGLPRNAVAFLRIYVMFLGLYLLTSGTALVTGYVLALDTDTSGFGGSLLMGVGLVAGQFGEYVRRSQPFNSSRGGYTPGRLVRYPGQRRAPFRRQRSQPVTCSASNP